MCRETFITQFMQFAYHPKKLLIDLLLKKPIVCDYLVDNAKVTLSKARFAEVGIFFHTQFFA